MDSLKDSINQLEGKINNLKSDLVDKDKETEDLEHEIEELPQMRDSNENLKHELGQISEELYTTKIELTKQHAIARENSEEIYKLKTMNKNLRKERNTLMKTAEKRLNEAKETIESKDKTIKLLSDKNKKLETEVSNSSSKSSPYVNVNCSIPEHSSYSGHGSACPDSNQNTHNSPSISTQTEATEETHVPYSISGPLPQIFKSQLLLKTPKISFLSKSLPRLDSISWYTPSEEDLLVDEMEEALSNQYDREITNFYFDKREQLREAR